MKRIKLVAVIAAIIAGVGIYQLLKDISKPQEIPRTMVVVALQDIPKNKVVTEEMVTLRAIATEALLPNVIKDPESIIGKVLSSKVYEGEQITVNRIVQDDQTDNLSYRITPGQRALSLAVSQVSGVAYMVKPEDHVDVIMTYREEVEVTKEESASAVQEENIATAEAQKKGKTTTESQEEGKTASKSQNDTETTAATAPLRTPAEVTESPTEEPETETITFTRYLLQNVRVLAVDAVMSEKGSTEYVTVTLEVSPKDALKVTNIDSQFNLRLVLRNGLDTDLEEAFDVDLSTITGKEDTP